MTKERKVVKYKNIICKHKFVTVIIIVFLLTTKEIAIFINSFIVNTLNISFPIDFGIFYPHEISAIIVGSFTFLVAVSIPFWISVYEIGRKGSPIAKSYVKYVFKSEDVILILFVFTLTLASRNVFVFIVNYLVLLCFLCERSAKAFGITFSKKKVLVDYVNSYFGENNSFDETLININKCFRPNAEFELGDKSMIFLTYPKIKEVNKLAMHEWKLKLEKMIKEKTKSKADEIDTESFSSGSIDVDKYISYKVTPNYSIRSLTLNVKAELEYGEQSSIYEIMLESFAQIFEYDKEFNLTDKYSLYLYTLLRKSKFDDFEEDLDILNNILEKNKDKVGEDDESEKVIFQVLSEMRGLFSNYDRNAKVKVVSSLLYNACSKHLKSVIKFDGPNYTIMAMKNISAAIKSNVFCDNEIDSIDQLMTYINRNISWNGTSLIEFINGLIMISVSFLNVNDSGKVSRQSIMYAKKFLSYIEFLRNDVARGRNKYYKADSNILNVCNEGLFVGVVYMLNNFIDESKDTKEIIELLDESKILSCGQSFLLDKHGWKDSFWDNVFMGT